MKITKLLENKEVMKLSGNSFKAYCVLLNQAKNGIIENFTIRGLTREWQEKPDLKLSTSKNTVKSILRELEDHKLIQNDSQNKVLYILE